VIQLLIKRLAEIRIKKINKIQSHIKICKIYAEKEIFEINLFPLGKYIFPAECDCANVKEHYINH
jgi:hypothetical protein